LDWVDVAKGICILLVVMFHSTLGVEKAIGHATALNAVIEWARPFRMPDFFLISGLFLAARIDRPWRNYFDSKVLHFVYFYVLWVHILLAVKAPSMIGELGVAGFLELYARSAIEPFSSLWFIYLLAVYFVVTKLLHGVPKPVMLAGAAMLHVLWPETGNFLADEFASRFVFFYSGYALSAWVFRYAESIATTPALLVASALFLWAGANAVAVTSGWTAVRGPDLAFSFVGIAAVVAISVLMVRSGWGEAIRYCGQNSISVYLAFTLFMGPVRQALLKFAGGLPGESVALASMMAGVLGALALSWAVKGTRLGFLFVRPEAMKLPALSGRWHSVRATFHGAVAIPPSGVESRR
jgi:uncharacterized membrane protein YcfT